MSLRREVADMGDNRNPVVDAWFEKYDNPRKNLVQDGSADACLFGQHHLPQRASANQLRTLILEADPRISELPI